MNEKLFEEDLSISYLRAVAAQAQVTFELRHRDENSIDVHLSKQTTTEGGNEFYAMFNVQLKATFSGYTETNTTIHYPLNVKNYNDLRRPASNSIILCLLILPNDCNGWISQTPEELCLKKCMYWLSLKDYPETQNTTSVTVEIPKINVVTVEALLNMIHDVANGGEL